MGFSVKLDDQIGKRLNKFLSKVETDVLFKAAKASINRTASQTRTRASKEIRKKVYKVKAKDLKTTMTINKAKGTSLNGLEASIKTRRRGFGLIRFVKSPKPPVTQKGIPLKKRKPVQVEVRPGRRIRLKRSFIQHSSKSFSFGVFQREGKKRQPFDFRRTPNLADAYFNKSKFRKPLIQFANRTLTKEFDKTFTFMLNRQISKQGAA